MVAPHAGGGTAAARDERSSMLGEALSGLDTGEPARARPLAHRDDFRLGAATVKPALRTLVGPAGSVTMEPKIMRVLLAFVDAQRPVVSREDLIRDCWGGRIVGEDAVNRTIAELRRAARQVDAGFTIETIPRIGYRLKNGDQPKTIARDAQTMAISRRTMSVALAGGLAIAGGVAAWRSATRNHEVVRGLIDDGRRALYDGYPDSGRVAAQHLTAALQRSPQDAEAWGLLAFAHRDTAENAAPDEVSRAVEASARAAHRALELDPAQGDALAALASLEPYFGEFANGEDRLMRVLRVDHANVLAMTQLVMLLQGVGRINTSSEWNERIARIDPQSPVAQYRRALKLWSMGRRDTAEAAIDRAMQLWPRHPSVWNARMMMFAYTGRPEGGLALLDDARSRPVSMKPPGVALWRASLRALQSGGAADIAAARATNLAAAPRSPGFANNALMTLSMLGELDAAFDVADGYFLRRGPLITTLWGGAGELPVSALRWRRTMALFVPPTAPMRADPRFANLSDAMGLARYWQQRNLLPDYRLAAAL